MEIDLNELDTLCTESPTRTIRSWYQCCRTPSSRPTSIARSRFFQNSPNTIVSETGWSATLSAKVSISLIVYRGCRGQSRSFSSFWYTQKNKWVGWDTAVKTNPESLHIVKSLSPTSDAGGPMPSSTLKLVFIPGLLSSAQDSNKMLVSQEAHFFFSPPL